MLCHLVNSTHTSSWVFDLQIFNTSFYFDFDTLYTFQVGIGRDRTLYAKYHGRVMVTTEKMDPNWDHKTVKRFKGLIQADEGAPIYKTYFHVLTESQKNNFKLVDQI